MTSHQSALDWLDRTQRFGIKLGLENSRRLLAALGRPDAGVACIHVAGTNGKGSTCAMIDSILREAGFLVGLYTSPHLVDLRERFRVQGKLISQADLSRHLHRIRDVTADWEHAPTYFEVTTAVAWMAFAECQVDVVVLETGMGGRLDATNVVTPVVSVITKIGMDHQQWLGNSLREIASEKAGIIKPGIPVVCAPQHPDALDVLTETALRNAATLTVINPTDAPGSMRLLGEHQRENAALAMAALRAANIDITDHAVQSGLARVQWPGRFQKFGNIWLDGAHNPDGVRALVRTWNQEGPAVSPIVLFGALADKGVDEMLSALQEVTDTIWLVPIQNPRAADPQTLAGCLRGTAPVWPTVQDAVVAAQATTRPVLVTGSLFLLGEVMSHLGISPFGD